MKLSPNRYRSLSPEAKEFNDRLELREGVLYVFPEEVEEATAISSRLALNGEAHQIDGFKTAIFLGSRSRFHQTTGGKLRTREHLFVVGSRERAAIVPLTFASEVEVPKAGFFSKLLGWLALVKSLTMAEVHNALQLGQTYEWKEQRSAVVLISVWDPVERKLTSDESIVHFKRGICEEILGPCEFCFRVEVLDRGTKQSVGKSALVSVMILNRKDLPRPVTAVSGKQE